MSELNWRDVSELRLHDKVLRRPGNLSQETDYLGGARVAAEGALLHVDVRDPHGPAPKPGDEYEIQIVPESAVKYIRYRAQEPVGPQVF
jgi:hypothetical protein